LAGQEPSIGSSKRAQPEHS
jgi:hypothetical protein